MLRHTIGTRVRTAFGGATLLLVVCLPALQGCFSGKFFVPPCTGTSCGGGGGTTPASSYAYVANETTGTIAGIPLPTAAFTSLTATTYTLGTPPSAVAATPKGTFLYVATKAGPVFVYTIGTNGALTIGNSSNPVVTGLAPTWLSVDPTGNWLFMLSFSSSQILVFQINTSTGLLTQTTQGTVALSAGTPTRVCVPPNGQNVYVGLGIGGLDGFSFDSATGVLSNQLHHSPLAPGGPADNSVAADNNSAFLFVGEAGSGIRVFTIGVGGALTEISRSPFTSQLGPAAIVVDPTNSYVYVANNTANVITGYTLGTSGSLTPLSSSPFTAGSGPSSMSLDSTGKYLLVISSGGGPDLQVFSFDAITAGKLDTVATTATGTDPTGPVSLSVVP